jgi:hypothetical protein
MDQILAVAIDVSAIPANTMQRFKILNLNITNQQGTSLNPTPIRPSLAQGTASGPATEGSRFKFGTTEPPKAYFITWPNQLPGDTIPTLSVNLVYTPVAPALPWEAGTFYPAGTIVMPRNKNGHYYIAVNSGSSDTEPDFGNHVVKLSTLHNGTGLKWKDMGQTPPTDAKAIQEWKTGERYGEGTMIQPPKDKVNGHYYRVMMSGTSAAPPNFPTDGSVVGSSPEPLLKDMGLIQLYPAPVKWTANSAYDKGALMQPDPPNQHYYRAESRGVTGLLAPALPVNGDTVPETERIELIDGGTTMPSNAKLRAWSKHTVYFLGDVILDPVTQHYWVVTQAGLSSGGDLEFEVPAPETVPGESEGQPVIWQDIGPTISSSVALGVPASDQTVNLLTYTYAQVHTLSRFNFAAGVVASTIRNRSFTPIGSAYSNSGTTYYNWNTIKNNITVDPVLTVTLYLKAMDAERKYQKSDFTPAPTIGFSLASPTKNFYFGFSSELFVRNLQLMYGFSLAQGSELQPITYQTSNTTPVTRQVLFKGGFIGLSFNISGFISSLAR